MCHEKPMYPKKPRYHKIIIINIDLIFVQASNRDDLSQYRQKFPDFVPEHSARKLENWIKDKNWHHLKTLSESRRSVVRKDFWYQYHQEGSNTREVDEGHRTYSLQAPQQEYPLWKDTYSNSLRFLTNHQFNYRLKGWSQTDS